jgi:phosphate transport system substrate-binding protein
VAWPGYGLGVKGNAGMVSQVQNMPNSIGYVAYAYAKQNDMTMVKLQNQAGQTVAASTQSFSAELKNANSAQSWPIMATSFVLVPNHNSKYAKDSPQVLKFFDWVYKNEDSSAEQLNYIPLTKSEYQTIEKQWQAQLPGWEK